MLRFPRKRRNAKFTHHVKRIQMPEVGVREGIDRNDCNETNKLGVS